MIVLLSNGTLNSLLELYTTDLLSILNKLSILLSNLSSVYILSVFSFSNKASTFIWVYYASESIMVKSIPSSWKVRNIFFKVVKLANDFA